MGRGNKRQEHRRREMRRVYDFLEGYIRDLGWPPSLKEMAQGLYMSKATVGRYLDLLEANGMIRRGEMRSNRAIGLVHCDLPGYMGEGRQGGGYSIYGGRDD